METPPIAQVSHGKDLPGYRIPVALPPPASGAPSWLNDNTLLGASLASGAALLVGAVIKLGVFGWAGIGDAATGGLITTLGFAATAASLVGGFLGNKYNEWEKGRIERDGLAIEPPSGLNRGILKGGVNGFSMVSGAAFLASLAATALGGATIAPYLMIAGPLIGVAAGAYGAYRGSKEEYDRQLMSYEASQRGFEVQQVERARAAEPALSQTIDRDGFTPYAHQGQGWHPAQERPDGASFAQSVRGPARQPQPGAESAPPGSGFADRMSERLEAAMRQGHLGLAQGN